jgi:hypothetical protein
MSHGRDARRIRRRHQALWRRPPALDAISRLIRDGEITGLVGPDAAGKTTLIRLMTAAEVLVFLFLGPKLLRAVTPTIALAVAASCGLVRWAVMAETADVAAPLFRLSIFKTRGPGDRNRRD